eukprot:2599394-Alexandrium_andersonii.AAC.1
MKVAEDAVKNSKKLCAADELRGRQRSAPLPRLEASVELRGPRWGDDSQLADARLQRPAGQLCA